MLYLTKNGVKVANNAKCLKFVPLVMCIYWNSAENSRKTFNKTSRVRMLISTYIPTSNFSLAFLPIFSARLLSYTFSFTKNNNHWQIIVFTNIFF